MNKSLYYIECKCIRDCNFPNVSFKAGDVVYFNKKAASNEMYMFNRYVNPDSSVSKNAYRYRGIGSWSYLPFTRLKKNAKKWQVRSYAEYIERVLKDIGDFEPIIKEIKITYEEEEV